MLETRKVTAHLPAKLLSRAQRATGEGITETIRRGLEMVAAAKAAGELRQLRGKVHLSIDVADLRRDRR
jgi:hypothetical protein